MDALVITRISKYRNTFVAVACLFLIATAQVGCAWIQPSDAVRDPDQLAHLTYGPILGRLGSDHIGIWARSNRPAEMQILYGADANSLKMVSDVVRTSLSADNTGWVLLNGLTPDSLYHYAVTFDGKIANESRGSFRTLVDPQNRISAANPNGVFDFRFVATSCGKQAPSDTVSLTAYETMLREQGTDVDFTMQLGDWSYEKNRDWPVARWQAEAVPSDSQIPVIVEYAPNLVGVWQNYKTYFDENPFRSEWHRRVPSYFAFDDHEVLNNFTDAAKIGTRRRASLFRDPGQQGWLDYLGWSNPRTSDRRIIFGRTTLAADDSVLFDPAADFSKLNLDDDTTLHIHWGGPLAGVRYDDDTGEDITSEIDEAGPQDPNAGVYKIVKILDEHRLQLYPAPKYESVSGYSVGVRNYYKFSVSNSEFFVLDTRSYRQMADGNPQHKPEILGDKQMTWLQDSMKNSVSDILFVVSPVSFSLPHLESLTPPVNDSSWTGFVDDRTELLNFWKSLNKTVIIVSGDMHDSYSIKWNDRLWEFGAGPFGSANRENSAKTGWRPEHGSFDSAGQLIDIRWSTFFKNGTPSSMRRQPVYAVFQVANGYSETSGEIVASPANSKPQVIVQFFDALEGGLLYSEAVETGVD